MDIADLKPILEKQGEAFEEFKKTHVESTKKRDVVLDEKLARIEKSLDDAVEAKAALEKRLDAEKKEREELELRLQRKGNGGGKDELAIELKEFNIALAAEHGKGFVPRSADEYLAYKAAFGQLLRKDNRLLTPEEIKTLSVGSDPDGGYLVTPDMSGRIVTKVYETSEMRSIASIQSISTDALEGIEDLGEAGAGYAGETSQGSDTTTPQVGKWRIPVFIIDTEPKATQSILDDASVDVEGWLAGKVSNKFARFENAEFVTGATKIRGITSYTGAADDGSGVTWGSVGYIATGTSADFGTTVATTSDKLIDLVSLLKQPYLPNARWLARRSVLAKVRKFKIGATVDSYVWSPGLGVNIPETILGFPVTRMEDMPAAAANSYSMAFGDFRQAYQIVDRQGIRVLRDPYTAKPYVKFYTTKRTGGGVINFEAYKLMKFGVS